MLLDDMYMRQFSGGPQSERFTAIASLESSLCRQTQWLSTLDLRQMSITSSSLQTTMRSLADQNENER
jgi:hypothetical protein